MTTYTYPPSRITDDAATLCDRLYAATHDPKVLLTYDHLTAIVNCLPELLRVGQEDTPARAAYSPHELGHMMQRLRSAAQREYVELPRLPDFTPETTPKPSTVARVYEGAIKLSDALSRFA